MKLNVRLTFAALIAAAALSGAMVTATSQPSFCQSCHEMKEDYRAWQASAHKEVSCVSCHIEPGAVNFVTHKVAALKEVGAHLTGAFETPINKSSEVSKEMPSENCVSCHESPGKKSNDRLIMDHDSHKETGLDCAYCHNRTAHPGLEGYESRMTMALCVDCHKKADDQSLLKCAACHPAGFKLAPDSHAKTTWAKGHGRTASPECQSCHFDKKRFCDDCHGMPMPHAKGWGDSHGEKKPLLNLCAKCHEQQYCDSCHKKE